MKNVSIVFNKKRVSFEVYDVLISLLVVTSLAFYDIKLVFLGIQAISIVLVLLQVYKFGIKKYIWNYLLWLVVFCGFSFLSIAWSASQNTTAFSVTLSIVQVGLIGLCVLMYARTRERIQKCINNFIFAAIVLCVRFFLTIPVQSWGQEERLSKDTIFGTNTPALVLAYAVVILMWQVFSKKNTMSSRQRLLNIVLMTAFMFVATMNGTKKSLIIFLAGFALLMIMHSQNPGALLIRMFLLLVVVALVYYLIMNIPILYGSIGYRLETWFAFFQGGDTDKSTMTRYLLMEDALRVFSEHPICGVGQDGYRYITQVYGHAMTYSHNNYVELLANLGVIGFLCFYALPINILLRAYRNLKHNKLPFVLIVIILVSDFAQVTYSSEVIYILFALCFTILFIDEKIK